MSLHFLSGYVLGQHGRQSARLAAQSAARSGASNEDIFDVEDRIDRLTLIVAAMWSLLQDQGLTEQQLQERIQALDLADGVADGKMSPQPTMCRECGSKVAAGLAACQFCGIAVEPSPEATAFDGV